MEKTPNQLNNTTLECRNYSMDQNQMYSKKGMEMVFTRAKLWTRNFQCPEELSYKDKV